MFKLSTKTVPSPLFFVSTLLFVFFPVCVRVCVRVCVYVLFSVEEVDVFWNNFKWHYTPMLTEGVISWSNEDGRYPNK